MQFRCDSGSYRVDVFVKNELVGWRGTVAYPISDDPHYLEIEWLAGDGTGLLKLWIDGTLKVTIAGLRNTSQRIDTNWLGPSMGIDTGTRGTY